MFNLDSLPNKTGELFRAICNAVERGLLLVDLEGRVVLANDLTARWLDLQAGDALPESQPALWRWVASVATGSSTGSETPLHLNGHELLLTIRPFMLEEQVVGVFCMLVRGTQVETMTRLLPSFETLARELDAIIDSSSDGLFVCDGEANVIRMNPASEKIHRTSADEVVGRNMQELIDAGFIDRSAALEASRTGEKVTLLQNKGERRLMSIATPVFDDGGKMVRIVVSERDISEIDRLQRELEEKSAMSDEFRQHILKMQQVEHDSRRVVARSPEMVRALEQAVKVSNVESSVLLLGESGVGKGLLADLIHQQSGRRKQPLIKINCGAIPESLIEAELFGYEKGAFTGAGDKGKPGQLELADHGIIFLDEIAELPLASQVKLLRFLEDGRITRLGGTEGRRLDVRIIAATHRDLEAMIEQGTFRHDLYYRLNVIPIYVPAVRERRECIVPLLRHYIEQFGRQVGAHKKLTREALDLLTAYHYPGNVRELMNICERLVVMTETEVIDVPDLPSRIAETDIESESKPLQWHEGHSLRKILDDVERQLLEQALVKCHNQTEMAEMLGMNQSTVARKLKKYELSG